MNKYLVSIVLVVLLQGCGTTQFHPPIHELAEASIPNFQVRGEVNIINEQSSIQPVIIHAYGGNKYQSNYNEITNTMVTQALLELQRHRIDTGADREKSIGITVTHLESKYIAFYWKGTMTFTVKLEQDQVFELTVNHTTGAGPAQDLSGSIADGVVALFKDERVKNYLAR